MNRPPFALLRALLPFGARPLNDLVDEYRVGGSAWVVYSQSVQVPCMLLEIHGYRSDANNATKPLVEEIERYQRYHSDVKIVQDAHPELRSEVLYWVDATVGRTQEYTRINSREFRVHHPEDPIWAHISLAWLSVPWYTPGMQIDGKKILREKDPHDSIPT